jgi:hypothetical protein
MSLDQAKYIFEIICKKKTHKKTLDHKIMEKHQPKKKKYISFGSLKTNTELPVQRWWFKSTPKLRTGFFLMLAVFL